MLSNLLLAVTQCPAIMGLSNGYPSKTGPVSIRDTVVISCDSGYEMIGNSTLLCTPDLIYDKPLPVCKGEMLLYGFELFHH